jgi:ATP-dependent exoDNAse (exonuclease V) beta subunit
MTLHSAKGLEFDTVFLPGWEEGVFPNQRALDDQGRAGLEEERRLAHVGLTRARRRAKIYFSSNRRMHGLWTSNIPSRFLDELPEAVVVVVESKGAFSAYTSRFDEMTHFGSSYTTPGWQREKRIAAGGMKAVRRHREAPRRRRRHATSPACGEKEIHRRSFEATARPPPSLSRSTGRQIDRHRLRVLDRRPRLPPEIRQRQRHRHRRQQAHHRLRQGRREARGG